MKACDFGQLGCPSPPVDVHCEDCQLMYHHHTGVQEEEVGICYRLPDQEDEVDRLSVSSWKKPYGHRPSGKNLTFLIAAAKATWRGTKYL